MNQLTNIHAFIKIWDSNVVNTVNKSFEKSKFNNINFKGDPYSDAAVTYTKNDSQFYDALEDGIKKVVLILIEKYNWITFSSCSGHAGINNQGYKKRMVQLLPRSDIEFDIIFSILNAISRTTNAHLKELLNPITINICEEHLVDEFSKTYKSIKIIFSSQNLSELMYFKFIDDATEIFCSQLEANFK